MFRRTAVVIGITLAALLAGYGPAQAAIITLDLDFTASGFSGAPVDPVTGSVSVTFDNASNTQFDQTTGVSVSNLNIALTDPPGFTYSPGFDSLSLGGVGTGCVNAACLMSGTNDFVLVLHNVSTSPTFFQFAYSQVGTEIFFTTTGTLQPNQIPVPEPASLALIALGFAGFGVRRRRQRAS